MEEKIKISLKESILSTLKKDCANFGFIKKSNELNKNAFINTLIVNYYESFSNNEESFKNDVFEVLKSIKKKDDIFDEIFKIINKKEYPLDKNEKTLSLSFKPTKSSQKAIEYISNMLIHNESISSYYRRLFTSYSHKPQNEREIIMFKENYDILTKSIKKNLKVCLTLKSGEILKDVSVYCVSHSNEELFNYVLLEHDKGKTFTIRLSKIKNISIITKERTFTENSVAIFEKQIKYGIQYTILENENSTIKIKLTPKGITLFEKLYVYRPICDKIEGDIYYFNCSYSQIYQYFCRFGKHAIILEPKILVERMRDYYYIANKAYKKAHPFNDKKKDN